MEGIRNVFRYIYVLLLVTVFWIGLEYVVDCSIHSSDADSIIAMILSYYITDKYLWNK